MDHRIEDRDIFVEPKGIPLREYLQDVYSKMDEEKKVDPPKGYKCWMDYLDTACNYPS